MNTKIKILHLEDVASDAELVERELIKTGLLYELKLVSDKAGFSKALQYFHPDIIIADNQLPSFDSKGALKMLKESGLNIPFVLVSSTVSDEFAIEMMREGAADYVFKDRLQRLPVAIETAIEKWRIETERQEYFEELNKSEEKFRGLIENSTDIISLTDENFKPIYRSPSTQRITGWTNEEREEFDSMELIHPDDRASIKIAMEEILKTPGKPHHLSLRTRHKDGHYMWLDGTLTNMLHNNSIKAIVANMQDITERKKAEEEIQTLATIVQRSPEFIGIASLDGRGIYLNEGGKQIVELDVDFRETNMFDYFAPDDLLIIQSQVLPEIEKTGRWVGEICLRNFKTGQRIPVLMDGFHIFHPTTHKPIAFATVTVNITERKIAGQALREKSDFIESIINASPDIIYIYDIEESKNVYFNDGIQKNLGYTDEEIKQMGDQLIPTLMHPEDFEHYLHSTYPKYGTLKDKQLITHQFRMRDKNGKWHWLYCKESIFLRGTDSKPKQIFGITTDITERKKAEEKIVESEKRFRALVENNEGIIAMLDENLHPVYWSSSGERIAGYKLEEIQQVKGVENVYPDDRELVLNTITELIKNPGKSISVLFRFEHKQGHYIWLEGISTNLLHDPIVKAIVVNMRDVTRQKEDEIAIEESNFSLSEAQRIAKIGDWTYYMNGDLKWSDNMYQLYGLPSKITTTSPALFFELVHPDDREKMQKWMQSCLSGETPGEYEFRSILHDGSIHYYEGSGEMKYDADKIPVYMRGTVQDITERKKAEEALNENRAFIESIINASPDIIYIYDIEERRNIYVNEGIQKNLGYSDEEIKQMGDEVIPMLMHPADFEDYLHTTYPKYEVLKDKEIIAHEFRMRDKNENWHWLDCKESIFLRNQDGMPKQIFGVATDITGRRETQLKLDKETRKRNLLLDNAEDGIFVLDHNFQVTETNKAFAKMIGISPESAIGTYPWDWDVIYCTKEILNEMWPELPMSPQKFETRLRHSSGSTFEAEITGSPAITDLTEQNHMMFICRDITERNKAEREIIREKNLSDSIINSLPGAFYLYTREGRFLRWNNNFETITGYSTDEIRHMHPLDFFDVSEQKLLAEKIANVFISGEDNVEANFLLKTREKIPYYFTGKAIQYEGSTCLMGVGIDISERVKAQEKIRQSTDQLRRLASHLQTIREEERKRIGREIHDELGQQLTAVKMDIAWIDKKITEENTALKTKLRNVIDMLDASNQSIRRILSELRPVILDSHGLVESIEWLARQFTDTSGIQVEFDISDRGIRLPEQYATCIFRVYQEAFTNITRYAQACKVEAVLSVKNDWLSISIKDDGLGFDTGNLDQKKSFGILGMKERIISLGGKFELTSSPGKGTAISAELPLFDQHN